MQLAKRKRMTAAAKSAMIHVAARPLALRLVEEIFMVPMLFLRRET
jgi:hypothetical protein